MKKSYLKEIGLIFLGVGLFLLAVASLILFTWLEHSLNDSSLYAGYPFFLALSFLAIGYIFLAKSKARGK